MTLLNNKLMDFCVKNKITSSNQMGYIPGNRTADAHIIHNLIQKHCHRNNLKIYSCFLDVSKAFDTNPHGTLLNTLLGDDIKGKFFNTIENIYTNHRACVKIDNKITDIFYINLGVRQGCILSPLLFNIFMSDLPRLLDSASQKVNPESNHPSCFIWADDILLSESDKGLEYMLKQMEGDCKGNELLLNTDKTKVMIFNKTGRLIRKNITLNNIQLETVR